MDSIEAIPPSRLNDQEVLVDKAAFQVSVDQLSELHNPKNFAVFQALGGLFGLAEALHTDTSAGLSLDETTVDSHQEGPTAADSKEAETEKCPSVHRKSTSGSSRQSKPYGDRICTFGTNRLPERKSKNFFQVT
jgi:Ca2+-transporting ATPase